MVSVLVESVSCFDKKTDVGYWIAIVRGITFFLLAQRKTMSSNINTGFKGLVLRFMRGKKVQYIFWRFGCTREFV